MKSPHQLSATEASRRMAAGELTSEALVRDCLERIESRESEILAWAFIDPESALAQARAADARRSRSPRSEPNLHPRDLPR